MVWPRPISKRTETCDFVDEADPKLQHAGELCGRAVYVAQDVQLPLQTNWSRIISICKYVPEVPKDDMVAINIRPKVACESRPGSGAVISATWHGARLAKICHSLRQGASSAFKGKAKEHRLRAGVLSLLQGTSRHRLSWISFRNVLLDSRARGCVSMLLASTCLSTACKEYLHMIMVTWIYSPLCGSTSCDCLWAWSVAGGCPAPLYPVWLVHCGYWFWMDVLVSPLVCQTLECWGSLRGVLVKHL